MRRVSRRTLVLLTLGAVAIPLCFAAAAYACTSIAELTESPTSAVAGSTVTLTGQFFDIGDAYAGTPNGPGPVQIRFGSLTGPVLASVVPSNANGLNRGFSVQIAIPANAVPGDSFFTATQADSTGSAVYGTPARQAFTVMAPPTAAPSVFAPLAACVVPTLTGMSATGAEALLVAAHCAVGTITHPRSRPHTARHMSLVVASTGFASGTVAANGTAVPFTIHWVRVA